MSIYVYRTANSTGALQLARALNGIRVRQVPALRAEDVLVCWGSHAGPQGNRIRALNNVPLGNKFEDAVKLKAAGVRTVEVSRQKPFAQQVPARFVDEPRRIINQAVINVNLKDLYNNVLEMAQDFAENEDPNFNSPVFVRGVNDFRDNVVSFAAALAGGNRVQADVARPRVQNPVPQGEWVGRLDNHKAGGDLLKPPAAPDYYVRKEVIVEEYRVHSFCGKSIRAGKKELREGFANPSKWVRTWDGGWQIKYDGVSVKQAHRDIAHAAVKALGLDFGAVDIGKLENGNLIVLEVNRAPGIEGGTVENYMNAVQRWMRGE